MSRMIGVDLGTTSSLVAYIRKTEPRIIGDDVLHPDYDPSIPSVVHLSQGGEWIVGKPAINAARISEEAAGHTVFSVRQLMGRDFDDPDCAEYVGKAANILERAPNGEVNILLRERRFSPQEFSAFILEGLKKDAESYFDEEVRHAVITVPAYFPSNEFI